MTPSPLLLHLGIIPPFPVVGGRAVTSRPEPKEPMPIHVTPEMYAMRGIGFDRKAYVVRTTHRGIDHHGGRFTDLGLAQAARDELEKKLGKTINVQVRKAPKKAGA
jgi:hypothetical protein